MNQNLKDEGTVAQKDLSAPPSSNEEPLVLMDENRGFFIFIRALKNGNLLCFFSENSFNVPTSTPQSFSEKKLRIFPFLNALRSLIQFLDRN
ncbi:MAG: hypothetical protein EBX52_07515 [Proteobacteria bacterium]|nr:hypothetical protein [Pseudomonadota bacterium]